MNSRPSVHPDDYQPDLQMRRFKIELTLSGAQREALARRLGLPGRATVRECASAAQGVLDFWLLGLTET